MRAFTRRLVLVMSDALLLNVGVLLAFLIRFEGRLPQGYVAAYAQIAAYFTLTSLCAFWFLGLYASLWRYASVDEIFMVLRGTGVSAGLLAVFTVVLPQLARLLGWADLYPVTGFPRSVVILTWLLITLMVGGLRFSARYTRRLRKGRRHTAPPAPQPAGRSQRLALVVGAGDAGALVVQELTRHAELGYKLVGLIDDDPAKLRLKIHGLPVLGSRQDLPAIVSQHGVDEVIIAMPSAPGRIMREIVESLRDLRVKIKTLPGLYELIGGSVGVSQIREVQIEDLLGREPVAIDLEAVAGYLRGRRVLVTGASGSIGAEICRQVARFQPQQLLLLDHDESGIFETTLDLQHRYRDLACQPLLADIRDGDKIRHLFAQYRPEVVFHAAAHKHVPLMEEHPDEAIKTNVFGTHNVARAAVEHRAARFVLISTDKAVNPSSVMGMTKRIAEMIIQALDVERRTGAVQTAFVAVRFGNVLGSRGSVVPIFKEQIARGGPVTVTHPDMRRYFMTIPEAVQLVIQAGAMGDGGEIFILDMGEPVRIADLADNLIRLSGFEPGVDIPIVFTGPRKGEKLFEELLTAEEGTAATRHQRIFVAHIPPVEPQWLQRELSHLTRVLARNPGAEVLTTRLRRLVPAAQPTWAAEAAASVEG